MRAILLFLAATAVLANAALDLSAPIACTQTKALYEITDTTATIGCTKYVNNMNVTWILKGDVDRVLDFHMLNSETSYDYIEIFHEGKTSGKFSGRNPSVHQLFFGPGDIRVTFKTDGSNIWEGFILAVFPRPTPHQLVSAQPFHATSRQDGGFVYFALPDLSRGRLFQLKVAITYDGLKPPGCFVYVDGFPTLERHHYTNATEKVGGIYMCTLSVAQPRAGVWTTGIFLYGAVAKMVVTATWTYELPQLQPSQLYNATAQAATPHQIYQMFVPVGVRTMKLQLSRESPGGFPVAYIAQGFLPTPERYQYVMDTREASYITLPINNPNPWGSAAPNPGTYIVLILPAEGDRAGYLFRADW